MGVKTLSSFADRKFVGKKCNPRTGEIRASSNCVDTLIIDGDGFQYFLHERSKLDWRHGGEYPDFYVYAREFLTNMVNSTKLDVVVVFDGGLSALKVDTYKRRSERKAEKAKELVKMARRCDFIMPVLMKDVLIDVCRGVERLQVYLCAQEADGELAALARKRNAWVMADDSDFFIYDTPGYIKTSSELFEGATNGVANGTLTSTATVNLREDIARWLKLPEDLLPVYATLCGNDYVSDDTLMMWHSKCRRSNRHSSRGRGGGRRQARAKKGGEDEVACEVHNYIASEWKNFERTGAGWDAFQEELLLKVDEVVTNTDTAQLIKAIRDSIQEYTRDDYELNEEAGGCEQVWIARGDAARCVHTADTLTTLYPPTVLEAPHDAHIDSWQDLIRPMCLALLTHLKKETIDIVRINPKTCKVVEETLHSHEVDTGATIDILPQDPNETPLVAFLRHLWTTGVIDNDTVRAVVVGSMRTELNCARWDPFEVDPILINLQAYLHHMWIWQCCIDAVCGRDLWPKQFWQQYSGVAWSKASKLASKGVTDDERLVLQSICGDAVMWEQWVDEPQPQPENESEQQETTAGPSGAVVNTLSDDGSHTDTGDSDDGVSTDDDDDDDDGFTIAVSNSKRRRRTRTTQQKANVNNSKPQESSSSSSFSSSSSTNPFQALMMDS